MTIPADFVLYDGECPVCSSFMAWSRLREIRPDIALIDARTDPGLVEQFRRQGVEINDTMVVRLGNLTLNGADAFAMIAGLAEPEPGISVRLIKWLANSRLSGPAYPVMAAARKVLLFTLGRGRIM